MADITVPTSKERQKLRNKADVPGGAVKGLNISKLFDEVHKASKGGVFDTLRPTETLQRSSTFIKRPCGRKRPT